MRHGGSPSTMPPGTATQPPRCPYWSRRSRTPSSPFRPSTTVPTPGKGTITMAAKRSTKLTPEQREQRIAELKATLDKAVLTLNDGSTWIEYLTTVANFGAHYSWGNQ